MRGHICSFQACPDVTKGITYERFKRNVLTAGRFSVFEATANDRSRAMYDKLCSDPEIVTDHDAIGYPWTAVRLKTPVEESNQR